MVENIFFSLEKRKKCRWKKNQVISYCMRKHSHSITWILELFRYTKISYVFPEKKKSQLSLGL